MLQLFAYIIFRDFFKIPNKVNLRNIKSFSPVR